MTNRDHLADRAKMVTVSGKVIDLLDPDPSLFDLADIEYALERLHRFAGHSNLSVLNHSLRVFMIVKARGYGWDLQRLALLHDAHEAYIGDVSSPLKAAMRELAMDDAGSQVSEYDVLDRLFTKAMAVRFDLPTSNTSHAVVKDADLVALSVEADLAWGHGTAVSWGLDAPIPGYNVTPTWASALQSVRL